MERYNGQHGLGNRTFVAETAYRTLVIAASAAFSPSPLAVILIVPAFPFCDLTIKSANPLNALR